MEKHHLFKHAKYQFMKSFKWTTPSLSISVCDAQPTMVHLTKHQIFTTPLDALVPSFPLVVSCMFGLTDATHEQNYGTHYIESPFECLETDGFDGVCQAFPKYLLIPITSYMPNCFAKPF